MMKPAEIMTRPTRSSHCSVWKTNRVKTSTTPTAMSPAMTHTYHWGLGSFALASTCLVGVGPMDFGLRRLDSGMMGDSVNHSTETLHLGAVSVGGWRVPEGDSYTRAVGRIRPVLVGQRARRFYWSRPCQV